MPTLDEVMAHCKTQINNAIRSDVSPFLVELFKHYYSTTVYSGSGGDYQRTQSALNAVEAIIQGTGNSYLIKLFSNPAKMEYSYPSWFPEHSQDNRDDIVGWLNYGTAGNPYYEHPAWNFVGLTEDAIATQLNRFFVGCLQRRGLKARVGGLF